MAAKKTPKEKSPKKLTKKQQLALDAQTKIEAEAKEAEAKAKAQEKINELVEGAKVYALSKAKGDATPKRITRRDMPPKNETLGILNSEFDRNILYLLEAAEGAYSHLLTTVHRCANPKCDVSGRIIDLHPRWDQPLLFAPSEITIDLLRDDPDYGDVSNKLFCLKTQESLEQHLKKFLANQLVEERKVKDIHHGLKLITDRMRKGTPHRLFFFYVALSHKTYKIEDQIQVADNINPNKDMVKRVAGRLGL